MLRQIIKPTQNALTLQLPDELVGKTVEVIAFEIEGEKVQEQSSKADRVKNVIEIFDGYRVDLSNFKFDRNEANDYD